MRIGLILPGGAVPEKAELAVLAAGLGQLGHAATVIDVPGAGVRRALGGPESLLRRRGFIGPLTHVPVTVGALLAGRFDVVHAFSVTDALAARCWRSRTGRSMVFTCAETLDRASVAHARLRLRLLAAALQDPDPVLAADTEGAMALKRWMAVETAVLPVADPRGALRVYEALRSGRGERG